MSDIVDAGGTATLAIIGNFPVSQARDPAQQVPLRKNELLSVTEMAWVVEADDLGNCAELDVVPQRDRQEL